MLPARERIMKTGEDLFLFSALSRPGGNNSGHQPAQRLGAVSTRILPAKAEKSRQKLKKFREKPVITNEWGVDREGSVSIFCRSVLR